MIYKPKEITRPAAVQHQDNVTYGFNSGIVSRKINLNSDFFSSKVFNKNQAAAPAGGSGSESKTSSILN